MSDDKNLPVPQSRLSDEEIQRELAELFRRGGRSKYARLLLAVMGSLPWVGGLLGAAGAYGAEREQGAANDLFRQWIESHRERINDLGRSLLEIVARLEQLGDEIQYRIESPEYLAIVRKAFRSWDQADTEEKRRLIQNLLTNAAGTALCEDDLIRLFVEWIDQYHETHFKVIAEIYQEPGITRGGIWTNIYGNPVREDSAEADLFKRLIRDLNIGGVIRQPRETTPDGHFVKKAPARRKARSPLLKSAFDDTEPYELTKLGEQFVHYTMNELVARVEAPEAE
ncbi:MAG: hypothetical protein U0836_24165 [Pirellulales bacterium]